MFLNKPGFLGLSILEMSKTEMYVFLYDYVNQSMAKKQSYVIWIRQLYSLYKNRRHLQSHGERCRNKI